MPNWLRNVLALVAGVVIGGTALKNSYRKNRPPLWTPQLKT